MGLSASKRVCRALRDSPAFNSTCDSVYEDCLALAQHAFPGVRPYQLASASDRLHHSLSTEIPLIRKWVPSPPTRSQVDTAFESVARRFGQGGEDITLGSEEFKAFAVELFGGAVVSGAGRAILQRVPVAVAGIAGIGVATRSGREVVGAVIGVYALGVATSVYLSLAP
ncbi:hypothetical protein RJ639_003272 [Escallonia herrerae]|uniref:Uncharacterized protein n=1 Tax=Escallonia herrerae TaxID=1293975 RepID=A0AA89AW96_9ASTE|nr:hypothetical protein RJ639_003272 [Escallonia herrerae]